MRRPFCIAMLLAVATFDVAAAGTIAAPVPDPSPAWVDPGWRRTVARISVIFDETGVNRRTTEFEYRAIDERGARAIAQQTFSYNSFFDDLTVSDLETLKADGRVISIDDRTIKDQPASTDSASPHFDDQRIKIAAFADVEPGDRIRGRLTSKSKRPVLAGSYMDVWTQPLDLPPEVMELTIEGPASLPLHIDARGVSEVEETRGDRMIHHVTFRQIDPKPLLDATDGFDTARHFAVSTFKDYAALAMEIDRRNAPMAVPDEAIERQSNEIVAGATTTRDKVERIHNWVAHHIRYVGIGLEDGGLTSQPAPAVLAARYGDCKAHATLLKALLSVQHIEADLVIINAKPRYTLASVATSDFDHAIVYVPALDLYLDPTAAWSAFGALPPALYGKPALNVDRGSLARLPVMRPDENRIRTETRYTLRPDGTREARSTLSGSGSGAAVSRAYASYLETIDRAQAAAQALVSAGLSGSGTYTFENPRELSDSFTIAAPFEITKALDLSRPGALRMLALTDPRPSIWSLVVGQEADTAFRCSSIDVQEVASLDLPDGLNVYEMPGDLAYDETIRGQTALGSVTGHLSSVGSMRVSGHTIRSEVRTRLAFDAPVCPAAFARDVRAALVKLNGFSHSAIGITPKAVSHVFDSEPDAVRARDAMTAGDYASALGLWFPLADRGSADAQNNIGWMYNSGKGVVQDSSEAFRWYLRSAALGNAVGESHVADLYRCGCGVVRSVEKAAVWYRRSAAQGFAHAEARLAEMAGSGVDSGLDQTVFRSDKAAIHDDFDAEHTPSRQ